MKENVVAVSMLIVSALGSAGCLSTKNIAPGAEVKMSQSEGLVVIGLGSEAKGLFYLGDYRDGRFKADGTFPKGVSLVSGEPYIVQRAEPTTEARRYGLQSLVLGDRVYNVGCGEQELPVLSVEAGKVQYFGDFTLVEQEGRVVLRHTFDIDKAQRYLDSTYPNSQLSLKNGSIVGAKSFECPTGPVAIYIYVPG